MISIINFVFVFILQWPSFILHDNFSQKKYHPPLSIPLVLAANFGELRSNHFHMGLDFKTQQREGLTLHAIDQGYIARVNISPYGYGRVVYINHPGGITSVYAHCQRLTGLLETKVKAFQKKAKSAEADIYFEPQELPVKKGEVFALSGNTGSSSGPHLHFEIRDTKTDEALNPLILGFDIADTRPPSLFHVKLYSVDSLGYLIPNKTKEYAVKHGTINEGTVTLPAHFVHKQGGIGFALSGVDRFDAANNPCGLYGTLLCVDGDTLMLQQIDRVAFEHTRYLNAYTDYLAFKAGKKFHKSFRSVVNPLQVYKSNSLGMLAVLPNRSYKIDYTAFDFAGNRTRLQFTLQIEDGEMSEKYGSIDPDQVFDPQKGWEKSWNEASVHLPISCAFEPFSKSAFWNGTSVFLSAGNLPVQEAFTVRMNALPSTPIQNQYLAVKRGTNWIALPTEWTGQQLEAKSKYFGEIRIQIDETGPYIKRVNQTKTISSKSTPRLVWKMGDFGSGLMNYALWINGEWHVLDYESKGDYAFFETKDMSPGTYVMLVEARDFCGNETSETFEITIE